MTSMADDEMIFHHFMLKWRERSFVVVGMGLKVNVFKERKYFLPKLTETYGRKRRKKKKKEKERKKERKKRRNMV